MIYLIVVCGGMALLHYLLDRRDRRVSERLLARILRGSGR